MRWGLVPYWAKDIKVSFTNINAMAATVDSKPAFRDAFATRCLVPIEAFYLGGDYAQGEAGGEGAQAA
jgi:putative SOS response-associated peptidase YedK